MLFRTTDEQDENDKSQSVFSLVGGPKQNSGSFLAFDADTIFMLIHMVLLFAIG